MSRIAELPKTDIVTEPTAVRVTARAGGDDVLKEITPNADDIPVAAVGSTGIEGIEPLLIATTGGVTRFYAGCSPALGREVIKALNSGEGFPDANWRVDHPSDVARLPFPTDGPLSLGDRSVLARAGWVAPTSIVDHRATGGFTAIRTAETDNNVADVVATIRGRGWTDASQDTPIIEEWETARSSDSEPVVVVNAHGAPADRLLLESTPFTVIEGAIVAATFIGAGELYVYLNEADKRAWERTEAAIQAIAEEFAVGIDLVSGPDAYKAGEPTMALEAIEGNHRLEARRRPPGPATYGLFGRPTLVHTPRTLAQVERALVDGATSTRLVTIVGDVANPATVELKADTPISAGLDAVSLDGGLKAACVGGQFGGVTTDLEVAARADSLAEAGLGTDGIVEVLSEGRCLVAFAGDRAAFAERENCGRCVPCREGSAQLARLLQEVYEGTYAPADIAELARVMQASSLCRFGVDASRPATSAMRTFEDEFRAHASGSCPTGACDTTDPPAISP